MSAPTFLGFPCFCSSNALFSAGLKFDSRRRVSGEVSHNEAGDVGCGGFMM
jgi:hypothetical protein